MCPSDYEIPEVPPREMTPEIQESLEKVMKYFKEKGEKGRFEIIDYRGLFERDSSNE